MWTSEKWKRSYAFQKNLVVWKLILPKYITINFWKFQKNLVVWKQRMEIARTEPKFKVSEELSSVETLHSQNMNGCLTNVSEELSSVET